MTNLTEGLKNDRASAGGDLLNPTLTRAFRTHIHPHDRFEDLIARAKVRLSNDPLLGGLDTL